MRAGPKAKIKVEPLDFGDYPIWRADRRLRFIGEYLVVPKGTGAKTPVKLRRFQQELIEGAYAEGVRSALVSMPRGNGKTSLAAMLALAEMFVGPDSAEVVVVASDQRQAEITYRTARRMVQLNEELFKRVHVFADKLYLPENDASLIPLPAEPGALHGFDPSLLIVDELHVVTERVWEAVTSATGKRPESLTLAISTPADSPDSIMWRLVEHGRDGRDPAFFFREFSAPDGCDATDKAAWREANPALSCENPFLAEDGIEAARRTLREPVFRQLRLGQWVKGVSAWLPFGAWDACIKPRKIHPVEPCVLAFDGSASGDSTALVGCTLDGHVWVQGLWESPPHDPQWRVPREQVADAIADAMCTYKVVELACDPWGWRSEIEGWARRFGRRKVLEWNTAHASRMAPATDRFYQAVADKAVSHDGDERLAAHLAHCIAKRTPMGDLVSKDKRGSPRKIDAAVAAIVAFDRARWHATKPAKKVVSFR